MSMPLLTLYWRAIGNYAIATVVQKSMQRPFFSQSP
jgi:hypothetical protein